MYIAMYIAFEDIFYIERFFLQKDFFYRKIFSMQYLKVVFL